ncbi:NADH dehydrogenase [ubiquinone] 1 alpha subcomplex subunit 6-like [Crassostrea virginica]|uniref:NADH dehydrogenase [ubiquinone] 1 alpha subcomplex subunit 6 n=1 Tax=Crassostrea virginica TaxID=6565 RepID=A0A8B8CU25_CRAVI|nr:NADH dehydrogenase [ubiquinone] 1 alpha subcomplex subunit 6-like [Crassostrea virginica]
MSTAYKVVGGLKQVKPIMSVNKAESKARVLKLYKAWYKQIPHMVQIYKLDVTVDEAYAKLREEFTKNKHVTDLRVIDLLIVKGQLELINTVEEFNQKTHLMRFFQDTHNKRPTDFLGKFYAGHDP